jgi:hypothetical protein
MATTSNGGAAFPMPSTASHNGQGGMSLRDYFAAHAPGDCSRYLLGFEFPEPRPEKPQGVDYHRRGGSADADSLSEITTKYESALCDWQDRRNRAQGAAARYAYADAMLKAREQ